MTMKQVAHLKNWKINWNDCQMFPEKPETYKVNLQLPESYVGIIRSNGGYGVLMAELPYLLSLHHCCHQLLPVVPRRRIWHLSPYRIQQTSPQFKCNANSDEIDSLLSLLTFRQFKKEWNVTMPMPEKVIIEKKLALTFHQFRYYSQVLFGFILLKLVSIITTLSHTKLQ